jgi:hypothetical protein
VSFREPRLLTPQRLSRVAGVPADWIWDEAVAGRIPHLRAGARIYFDPEVVLRILLERANTDGGDAKCPRLQGGPGVQNRGGRREVRSELRGSRVGGHGEPSVRSRAASDAGSVDRGVQP